MHRPKALPTLLSGLVFLVACGDDAMPEPDMGSDSSSMCTSDIECGDGRFCNGAEACDPTSSAAGSLGSCNYCDDTDPTDGSDGLVEEVGIATVSASDVLDARDGMMRLAGDAAADTLGQVSLVDGATNRLGAIFAPARVVGYGPIQVGVGMKVGQDGTTAAVPGDGWSFVALRTPFDLAAYESASFPLGVPPTADGFAVEWSFGSAGDDTDEIRIRQLNAAGADPIVGEQTGGFQGALDDDTNSGAGNQSIEIFVTRDDPRTAGDETEVEVQSAFDSGLVVARCGGASAACGFTVAPGDEFLFGLAASTSSRVATVSTRSRTFPSGVTELPFVSRGGLCR